MLWPDPAQRDRLAEIRDNLIARIAEREREGWLGEVEGLHISLVGANDKLAQIDRRSRESATVDLGLPTRQRRGTLNQDADHGEPIRGLDSWAIERLEAFAVTQDGEELEQVRVIAQSHAYRFEEPGHVRRRWAKLSLRANERLHGDGPWDQARMASQAFALRTWVIEHLGPDADPDWNPEILAADTLAALTVDPDDARTISAGWRDLPIEQIGELRRQKNLTAHLDKLVDILQPSPIKDRLVVWAEVRKLLP